MDRSLVRIFDFFMEDLQQDDEFTIWDFIEYVKIRYPRKTPTTTTVSCLCKRNERCRSTGERGVYLVIE